MNKLKFLILAGVLLLAACQQQVVSPAATPTSLVIQSPLPAPATATPQIWTPTPEPQYVRQPAIESSRLCVLSANPNGCVVFLNRTGAMVGITRDRAERELKWGYDLSLDLEAVLLYDKIENRMEVVPLDSSMTEMRIDNGGVIACEGETNCWREYFPTVGIALEDAVFMLKEASRNALADAIVDARALSAMGQLCFAESGKEISFLRPCVSATSTLIPTP